MKVGLRNPRDVFAGLIFVAFGAAAIWFARDYPLGTSTRMGPGYFPVALGAVLLLLGIIVCIRGVLTPGSLVEAISLRAVVLVLAAIGAFAATLESAGIVVATILLIGISAAASPESRPREVIVLTAVMLGLAVGLFYYGLGLPFRLLPA
jgi:putative tricarboxylic transport membrane protein